MFSTSAIDINGKSMKKELNVVSFFDWCSAGQLALFQLGIKVKNYFAYEIDKYARQITNKNFPDTKQMGDILNFNIKELPKIDLFIGGSPCTGFSFAGKQLNFKDPQSKLFFNYVDALNELRKVNPDILFFLENVNMKKEYLRIISEHMGIHPQNLNSNLVSAQNRNRWYWSNIKTKKEGLFSELHTYIPIPEDRKIFLDDIVQNEDEVNEKYYIKGNQLKWWDKNKEFQLKKKYSALNGKKSICQTARQYASWNGQFINCSLRPVRSKEAKEERRKTGTHKFSQRDIDIREDNKIGALMTSLDIEHHILSNNGLRKLTPIECERLQTFPDDYTKGVSDSQRYKMMGNSWTVEIIKEYFRYIKLF